MEKFIVMEHKLINTGDYLLIVDESDIKEGDTYCRIDTGLLFSSLKGSNPNIIEKYCKKIIAHLPLNNSPRLEGVDLLPPLEDEVKKLAKQEAEKLHHKGKHDDWDIYNQLVYEDTEMIKIGYNKAKEKYKYTEEDMWEIFVRGIGVVKLEQELSVNVVFDQYIQSLQQPKMPVGFNCVCGCSQCEARKQGFTLNTNCKKEYITTNSGGLTQWVGEWIYSIL
jgi:hypothetical protein